MEICWLLSKLLWLDANTNLVARGKFARICVEVDLAKPLIPRIKIGDLIQKVKYEAINTVCFRSGVVAHRVDNYLLENIGVVSECLSDGITVAKERGLMVTRTTKVNGDTSNSTNYGSWMMV